MTDLKVKSLIWISSFYFNFIWINFKFNLMFLFWPNDRVKQFKRNWQKQSITHQQITHNSLKHIIKETKETPDGCATMINSHSVLLAQQKQLHYYYITIIHDMQHSCVLLNTMKTIINSSQDNLYNNIDSTHESIS